MVGYTYICSGPFRNSGHTGIVRGAPELTGLYRYGLGICGIAGLVRNGKYMYSGHTFHIGIRRYALILRYLVPISHYLQYLNSGELPLNCQPRFVAYSMQTSSNLVRAALENGSSALADGEGWKLDQINPTIIFTLQSAGFAG